MRRSGQTGLVIHNWQPALQRPEPDDDGYDRTDRTYLALVLGVISLLFGPLGIIAWAVSDDCLRAIAAGRMDPAGEANARAGRVLGIVAMCMFIAKVIGLTIAITAFDWRPFAF
jgi:hypothetical protein